MNFNYEADNKKIKVTCTNGNMNIGKCPDQKEEPGFYLYNTIVMITMMERQIKFLMSQITGQTKRVLDYTEIMDKGIEQRTAKEVLQQEANMLITIKDYLVKNVLVALANLCAEKYKAIVAEQLPETASDTARTTPIC